MNFASRPPTEPVGETPGGGAGWLLQPPAQSIVRSAAAAAPWIRRLPRPAPTAIRPCDMVAPRSGQGDEFQFACAEPARAGGGHDNRLAELRGLAVLERDGGLDVEDHARLEDDV